MDGEKAKISFQKAWHIQVAGLRLLDFASDHHSFVAVDKDSIIRLFNSQGHELWQRNAGYEITSISLSDTLEVLAVDSDKHAMLFGPEGATLWRKRPFPAIMGKISAAGDSFAFVTSDPAIIGTDRTLRVKWAYRNLMKRPACIEVSALGQTTAFACFDDRGEGLAAVNQSGKPYDAFMGLGTITDLELNEDGQIAIATTENGKTFCLNLVKGYGIWKGEPGHKTSGVSFASQNGESLVYSQTGQLLKLSADGTPQWEHWFPDRLLKASITADGKGIFYATERGEIGLLLQAGDQQNNRLMFQKVEVAPLSPSAKANFRKVWAIELPGKSDKHPAMHSWLGQDGVEYSLIWDSEENLFCLNDIGEEIWQHRFNNDAVVAISASSEADLAVVITQSGVSGFDLSGCELFRFFGQFKDVHVFDNGAILLLDDTMSCRYYQAYDHFSHAITTEEPVSRIVSFASLAILQCRQRFYLLDCSGEVVRETFLAADISCLETTDNDQFIVCGTENGMISIETCETDRVFSYQLEGRIASLSYNKDQETLFVGTADGSIHVLQRRTGQMTTTAITGTPSFIINHESGAVVATDLDQLCLINFCGQLLSRYTLPFRLSRLSACRRRLCMLVLSDETISCLAAVEEGK